MKITHRKITASTSSNSIPQPFDQFYRIASDEEIFDLFGESDYLVEYLDAYDAKHLAWLVAKDEYFDQLAEDGLEALELVDEGDEIFLGYTVGDRIYALEVSDLEAAGVLDSSDINSCDKITGAVDTGLEYWYYSPHGVIAPKGVQVLDWYEEGYKTWLLLDKMLTTQELNDYEFKEQCPPEGVSTHNGTVIECSVADDFADEVKKYTDKQNRMIGELDDIQEELKQKSGIDKKKKFSLFNKKKNVAASDVTKVSEDENSINYVVSSEDIDATEDFVVDYDLSKISDAKWKEMERQRIAREMADEADAWDLEHGEGQYEDIDAAEDIEARSLAFYKNYKVMSSPETGGWDVLDGTNRTVKTGFSTESKAREFIDTLADGQLAASTTIYGEEEDPEDIYGVDEPDESAVEFDDNVDGQVPEEELIQDIIVPVDFNTTITVNNDGDWEFNEDAFLDAIEDHSAEGLSFDTIYSDLHNLLTWNIPDKEGKYQISGSLVLTYNRNYNNVDQVMDITLDTANTAVTDFNISPASKVESKTDLEDAESIEAAREIEPDFIDEEEAELDRRILNGEPFDIDTFKKYKTSKMLPDSLKASEIEVGDTIDIEEDASQINLGTVVKVLNIVSGKVDWADLTFKCKIIDLEKPGEMYDAETGKVVEIGDEIELNFDMNDPVGPLVID